MRIYLVRFTIFLLLSLSCHIPAFAEEPAKSVDRVEFEKLFTDWVAAFNRKDLAATCNIFSPEVHASYQGLPVKNYDVLCDGFKRLFAEPNKKYQYSYTLHEIYREGNLAAVRVTWHLDIKDKENPFSSVRDEGLDVLVKDTSGHWKIVNYIAYPVIERFNGIS